MRVFKRDSANGIEVKFPREVLVHARMIDEHARVRNAPIRNVDNGFDTRVDIAYVDLRGKPVLRTEVLSGEANSFYAPHYAKPETPRVVPAFVPGRSARLGSARVTRSPTGLIYIKPR